MSFFKILFLSSVVISAGILLTLSAPVIADFAVNEWRSIHDGVISLLRPPYLYLVMNCIIITIVASTKLHSVSDKDVHQVSPTLPLLETAVTVNDRQLSHTDNCAYNEAVVVGGDSDVKVPHSEEREPPEKQNEDRNEDDKVNELLITNPTCNTVKDSTIDKSLVSARFGRRKSLKSTSEGGKAVLRVSKSKKQDTLESTWKAITEGRSMPLKRHLQKNETWERASSPKIIMSKAETFCRSPLMTPLPGSGKLKKDPSLSQDELNRRVEAFIKKFNDEMRLQRQESLNQYVHMVKQSS